MDKISGKIKTILWGIGFVLGCGLPGLQAQETVLAAGCNITSSGGAVSYSVGQVACNANIAVEGITDEGVQQPFEIYIMPGIEENITTGLNCRVYPNPTGGDIILNIEKTDIENLGYQLLDMNGVLLQKMKIAQKETIIPMVGLACATYLLTITENNIAIVTYKIVKK